MFKRFRRRRINPILREAYRGRQMVKYKIGLLLYPFLILWREWKRGDLKEVRVSLQMAGGFSKN